MMVPFYRVEKVALTASTNADVMAAARAGAAEGLVIRAVAQTAGRGRQGRRWESPEGNLYMSLLLRPEALTAQEAGAYSFVAALAVYETVRFFLPDADVRLKWPNDVLVGGGKISGVLVENGPVEDGRVPWVVVGIGVNVAHHPEIAPGGVSSTARATSLAACGAMADVELVVEVLLASIEVWRATLRDGGFAAIREAWQARAPRGPVVAVVGGAGARIEGEFLRLDEVGRMVLRLADGSERAIAAGDVHFAAG